MYRSAPPTSVRLSFDISPELNDVIEQLAVKIHGTRADVFRKAITLMYLAVDAKENGLKFGVAHSDQILLTEIVGLS